MVSKVPRYHAGSVIPKTAGRCRHPRAVCVLVGVFTCLGVGSRSFPVWLRGSKRRMPFVVICRDSHPDGVAIKARHVETP